MAITWNEQGPRSIISGANVLVQNRPQIGAIIAAAPDPNDENTIVIGSVNGGIWKTKNAKAPNPTWTLSSIDGLPEKSSPSVGVVDYNYSDKTYQTMIAGLGKFSSFDSLGGRQTGLLRSKDGGDTWTSIGNLSATNLNIADVAWNGDTMLVASDEGVYLSTNAKTDNPTFTQMTKDLPQGASFKDLVQEVKQPGTFYVTALKNGIYKTTDSGQSWSDITPKDNNGNKIINAANTNLRIVGSLDDTTLYAGVINNSVLDSIWKSTDKGTNWTKLGKPPEQVATQSVHFSLVVDPTNANIFYLAGATQPENPTTQTLPNNLGADLWYGILFRGDSSKPETKWDHLSLQDPLVVKSQTTGSAPHADSRNLFFDKDNNLIDLNDGGIYKRANPTTNTGSWTSLNGNLGITELHSVSYDRNTRTIMGGAQDNGSIEGPYRSGSEPYKPWQETNGGDGGRVRVDNNGSDYSVRYSSSQNLSGLQYQKFDASNPTVVAKKVYVYPYITNTTESEKYLNKYDTFPFIAPLELNKVQAGALIVGSDKGVYESLDYGETAKDLINKGFPAPVTAIAYGGKLGGKNNPDVLYVATGATQTSNFPFGSKIYVRQAKDKALTPVTDLGTTDPNDTVQDIVLDPNDYQKAYLVTKNQIFRTENAGTDWKEITGNILGANGLAPSSLATIEYVSGGQDGLLVGGLGGVYFIKSPNKAGKEATWSKLGNGLPDIRVQDMTYDDKANILVIGTLGRGAWSAENVVQEFGGVAPPPLPAPPTPAPTPAPTADNPNSKPEPGSSKPEISGPSEPGKPRLYIPLWSLSEFN